MTIKRCFAPVVNNDTRVLILGSLPGEISLAQGQYYAHKQNRFWHLVGDVIGEALPDMSYADRLLRLQEHGIGLWDVVAEANRIGSLDSQIRNHAQNDLSALVGTLPTLRAIAFNGGTAEKIGRSALAEEGHSPYAMLRLPSSSPAYAAIRYAEKAALWGALKAFL